MAKSNSSAEAVMLHEKKIGDKNGLAADTFDECLDEMNIVFTKNKVQLLCC